MGYGTSPMRWTVLTANDQGSGTFDLQAHDILEFTGDGNGDDNSIVVRRRGPAQKNWGGNCVYDDTDPALPKVTGIHLASGKRKDTFELRIAPSTGKDQQGGDITRGTGGTGGNGTWTAEEGP